MNDFLHLLLALGGFAAAVAIGLMCGISLLVWLAGGSRSRSETWPGADEL